MGGEGKPDGREEFLCLHFSCLAIKDEFYFTACHTQGQSRTSSPPEWSPALTVSALGAGGRRSRPPHLQDSSPHPDLTISQATELAAACHMVHPRARERFPALPAQQGSCLHSGHSDVQVGRWTRPLMPRIAIPRL